VDTRRLFKGIGSNEQDAAKCEFELLTSCVKVCVSTSRKILVYVGVIASSFPGARDNIQTFNSYFGTVGMGKYSDTRTRPQIFVVRARKHYSIAIYADQCAICGEKKNGRAVASQATFAKNQTQSTEPGEKCGNGSPPSLRPYLRRATPPHVLFSPCSSPC